MFLWTDESSRRWPARRHSFAEPEPRRPAINIARLAQPVQRGVVLHFCFVLRIGLKVHFHDLRYTHASQSLRGGTSPKVVPERLGRGTIGITLDVYSHVLSTMQEEAAAEVYAQVAGNRLPGVGQ